MQITTGMSFLVQFDQATGFQLLLNQLAVFFFRTCTPMHGLALGQGGNLVYPGLQLRKSGHCVFLIGGPSGGARWYESGNDVFDVRVKFFTAQVRGLMLALQLQVAEIDRIGQSRLVTRLTLGHSHFPEGR